MSDAAQTTGTEVTDTTAATTDTTQAAAATGNANADLFGAESQQQTETANTEQTNQEQQDADALKMPAKDAPAEEWEAFYAKIGRPETPDGYELPIPEGDDGAFAKQVAPMLHKHGITAEQAKGLANDWNAMQAAAKENYEKSLAEQDAAIDARNKAESEELTKEWGAQATANMEFARRGVTQFIPGDQARQQKVIASMERTLGYRDTIKFFHNIGKAIGEHDAAGLGTQNGANGTPKSTAEVLYGGTSK